MTAREAARMLAPLGLNRTRTQIVLDSGLAGDPVRTPAAHLYDAAAVLRLATRSEVPWADRHLLGGHTLLVARGEFDSRRPTDELVRTFLSNAAIGLVVHEHLPLRRPATLRGRIGASHSAEESKPERTQDREEIA